MWVHCELLASSFDRNVPSLRSVPARSTRGQLALHVHKMAHTTNPLLRTYWLSEPCSTPPLRVRPGLDRVRPTGRARLRVGPLHACRPGVWRQGRSRGHRSVLGRSSWATCRRRRRGRGRRRSGRSGGPRAVQYAPNPFHESCDARRGQVDLGSTGVWLANAR